MLFRDLYKYSNKYDTDIFETPIKINLMIGIEINIITYLLSTTSTNLVKYRYKSIISLIVSPAQGTLLDANPKYRCTVTRFIQSKGSLTCVLQRSSVLRRSMFTSLILF